jgi:hypothetical protein
MYHSLTVTSSHTRSLLFTASLLSCHYSAPGNSEELTQFNSKLISWQAGISKLDSSLSAQLLCVYCFSVSTCQSQGHIATDSKSWCSWPDIYYCLTVTVLFLWDVFSDKRTCLSFVYAAGPCQCSLSRVWVPRGCDHILLSQIWDFPFRCLLWLAGSQWRYSSPPPHRFCLVMAAGATIMRQKWPLSIYNPWAWTPWKV